MGTQALNLAHALDETEIAIHALNTVGTARFINGAAKADSSLSAASRSPGMLGSKSMSAAR
ncbi:MAG: hypothetical protein WAL63_15425 [Solirubrobacteraceae bacterium]